jgi:hypothetical protein
VRIRHKIPSLFSLSMVDVLCCALGCVILLWLLGARQAQDESDQRLTETEALRLEARAERERSEKRLAGEREQSEKRLAGERDRAVALEARLAERIRALEEVRDGLQGKLADERKRASDLDRKLKTSQARVSNLEADVRSGAARLDVERKRMGRLDRKLSDAEAGLKGLRGDLERARVREDRDRRDAVEMRRTIDARQRDLSALNRTLEEARTARSKLEKTLAARDKELQGARLYKDRLVAAEERERYLEKQLKERHTAMQEADKSLTALRRRATALEATARSRFAGIELTGKRVVFLVDISGSMVRLDENTKAPGKWLEVRNTVARLMRSLAELEKFQVVLFNNKIAYLMGSEGKWIDHEGEASVKKVQDALAKVTVRGGTNMYAALDAAFRYRKDGLDAVYLLSDGLPNQGEGVDPARLKTMRELERGTMLGRYIRRKLKVDWNREEKGRERVKINAIGFFYESPDLGAFLWALARENEGSFVGMSKP